MGTPIPTDEHRRRLYDTCREILTTSLKYFLKGTPVSTSDFTSPSLPLVLPDSVNKHVEW